MTPNEDWRGWSASQREREFSPSSCIGGNYQPFIQAYRARSAQAWALGGWEPLPIGAQQPGHWLLRRLPPAAAARGWLAFIHGGYWQELSARDSLFAAAQAAAQGWHFAALEYPLAPAAKVASIGALCAQALQVLAQQAQGLPLVLAGSSAGAHLCAMAALGAPGAAQGLVLVSGVYDLRPLVGTSINTALGLDEAAAWAASPARLGAAGLPPTSLCWGEHETGAFKQQSRDYAAQLQAAGVPVQAFEVHGRNHFDVILDLAEPHTALGRATAARFS